MMSIYEFLFTDIKDALVILNWAQANYNVGVIAKHVCHCN